MEKKVLQSPFTKKRAASVLQRQEESCFFRQILLKERSTKAGAFALLFPLAINPVHRCLPTIQAKKTILSINSLGYHQKTGILILLSKMVTLEKLFFVVHPEEQPSEPHQPYVQAVTNTQMAASSNRELCSAFFLPCFSKGTHLEI